MCNSYESIKRMAHYYIKQQPIIDDGAEPNEQITIAGSFSTYSLNLECSTLSQAADIIALFNTQCNIGNFKSPKPSQKVIISAVRITVEKHTSQIHNIVLIPTLWNILMGTDLAKQDKHLFSPNVSFQVACCENIRRISNNGIRFFFTTELIDVTTAFNL